MTPEDAQTILRENFAPWVQALDLTVLVFDQGRTQVRMPLGDHLSRVGGIVSGQALAALADTSMALATIAQAQIFRPFATTDLHTRFLRPGLGTAILCDARVIRAGRALVFAEAEMTEESSGKLVSTATAAFYAP
ncbi:PaaI family thioesterase [Sedimentitalea todarodis]|uniref:PaaI family thioesterase n=1 Tax=Sedimentitalea todarodis TaxID=1631240 RepID=A0ABU3VJL2_9RHOB|nr:PaaI family thioesterase [Sedimentitalea todarodis]MDU9006283.1 PaaI family thioesterase [Sedimentitalea todarodis]